MGCLVEYEIIFHRLNRNPSDRRFSEVLQNKLSETPGFEVITILSEIKPLNSLNRVVNDNLGGILFQK